VDEKKAYMANEIVGMQMIKIFRIWSLILTHSFLILPKDITTINC
jgi:hypothetical protein